MSKQLTAAGMGALRAASLREDGRYLYVPLAAYESVCREHRRPGAGDHVSRVLKALGVPECGWCRKRREWMNGRFQAKNGMS